MTSENGPTIDDRTHDPGLHLFLDDHEVASVTNLTPVSGRPRRRAEPVVRPDRPWEGDQINAWGTVLRRPEDGMLQLWYSTGYMGKEDRIPVTLCYAESRDGIAWDKPDLMLLFHALDDAQRARQRSHPLDRKLVLLAVTAARQATYPSVPVDLDPMVGQVLFPTRSADIQRSSHLADRDDSQSGSVSQIR